VQRFSRRHRGIARNRAQALASSEPTADFLGELLRIADPPAFGSAAAGDRRPVRLARRGRVPARSAFYGMEQATFEARNFARVTITAAFTLPRMRDVL
jgi:hypothetical protein